MRACLKKSADLVGQASSLSACGLPARGTACLAWGWKPRNRQARGTVLLFRQALRRNHADGSGWHGQRAHQRVDSRRTQSGGRVARHNRPVACSTQTSTASFRLRTCLKSRTVPLACLFRGFQPHARQAMPQAGSPQADRLEACPTGPAGLLRQALRNSAGLRVAGCGFPSVTLTFGQRLDSTRQGLQVDG